MAMPERRLVGKRLPVERPRAKPAVEELLNSSVVALRPFLHTNVRMEKRDTGAKYSRHFSNQIRGIVSAAYRLEEQRGGVARCNQAPVLCRKELRSLERIRIADPRFPQIHW